MIRGTGLALLITFGIAVIVQALALALIVPLGPKSWYLVQVLTHLILLGLSWCLASMGRRMFRRVDQTTTDNFAFVVAFTASAFFLWLSAGIGLLAVLYSLVILLLGYGGLRTRLWRYVQSGEPPAAMDGSDTPVWKRRLIVGGCLFVLLPFWGPVVMGQVDYMLVATGQVPAFAVGGMVFDGGTGMYDGFGYTVFRHHGMAYQARKYGWENAGWTEGPELRYWWPSLSFLNRSHLKLSPPPKRDLEESSTTAP
ncbi:MAG: hypothetical protein B9S32_04110 [Verrucomicrobia bacterium Tous-C9LFEB]|nr:MAG: hypothetical protein B9S32_04110 [Verrucomicrobia bacterium Tous-C9LFEB]